MRRAGDLDLDAIVGAESASGSGTSASTASITVAASSELLFAAGMTSATFTTPGSGFTSRVVTTPDGDIVGDAIAGAAGIGIADVRSVALQLAAFRSP